MTSNLILPIILLLALKEGVFVTKKPDPFSTVAGQAGLPVEMLDASNHSVFSFAF